MDRANNGWKFRRIFESVSFIPVGSGSLVGQFMVTLREKDSQEELQCYSGGWGLID